MNCDTVSESGVVDPISMSNKLPSIIFERGLMKTKSNVQNLSVEAIESFLQRSRVGVLALADGGAPYGLPLAYFYDAGIMYLTMSRTGRKMDIIGKNKKASFTVFAIPDDFGAPGKTNWTSVICEGELENITEPAEITAAVRAGERHMGMPAGTWDKLLEMVLLNPDQSNFWRIASPRFGGRGVENERIEFEA